ncbi:polysaccharide deacetylase family protein [Brevibacillus ginsengisoli]|uniref:polysaccharide deacetylase family protein n=1 Tax=Brevibacillus ginsengisoli TaxID=363854 RepID=UPI003CEF620C
MAVYHEKVLELVAIETINEKSYLRIKFFLEQEVELFWETDSDTAANLMTVTEFDENHRYRLSLHTTFDETKQQWMSFITRTYRDKGDRIYFTCSVHYKNDLEAIKNTQSINDLNRLPFLSVNLSETDDNKIKQNYELKEPVISKANKNTPKWVIVAMISVILVILFGHFNNPYFNKKSNNTIVAKAEVTTASATVTKLVKDHSTQDSLPYLKLDNPITFSLPKGYVSLTFDDGPSKYTEKITDILKKYKVGGTFFFIGYNVKKHPDSVRYVHSNGYSIGSHSMNHVKMSNLSYEQQANELVQSSHAIKDLTNEDVVLLRPPYGAINEQTKALVHDYRDKMVLWDRDPRDWKTHDATKIFHYVCSTEASGSIILLHESQATIDALPKIIEHLQEQNLKIVSLK